MQIAEEFGVRSEPNQDRVQQWVKTGLLFGLGVYFVYNIASGNLANYINARFAWLSYVAAALFLILGAASLYSIRRQTSQVNRSDHQRITWQIILIVALPLIMGTLIPSRPLGAEAINGGFSLNSVSVGGASTVSQNPLDRNVLDWARLFVQSNIPSQFDGEPAKVVGFVYREPNFPEDKFMLVRFTVACCVADASPIGLVVRSEDAVQYADNQWLEIEGTFQAGEFTGEQIPILEATQVAMIEQPEHPYLYP